MTLRNRFVCLLLFVCQFILAQNDSINNLREVTVSDTNLKNFSKSRSITIISDSIIKKNQPSLTSLLNYNTTIYFKENGLGMVSSPSFRGTTAQQTAVVWNGININSQLLGQTDFNTISVRDFNSISVRPGGGSSIYGSGAIGGSIHLNTDLSFKNNISNDLFLNYGSFNTYGLNNKISISNSKTSINFSISRNQSQNDYQYLDTDLKNENGQFENTSLNVGFGYKLNSRSILKLYSQFYDSDRNFSGTLYYKSYSKYKDLNTRNLVLWNFDGTKLSSELKLAALSEQYKYFQNFDLPNFETSTAKTNIANYNLGYIIATKIKINTILEYVAIKGFGKNIGDNIRISRNASIFLNHQIFRKLHYDVSFRKEFTAAFESPFLYSFGLESKLNSTYKTKFLFSKNFRVPTFNDLYWVSGGNLNLKPEIASQVEFGNDLTFKNLQLRLNVFYNQMENMIRWTPTNGNWSPENVFAVANYGLESILVFNHKVNKHLFAVNTSYAYTVSENLETKKQLTFVPFHKFATNFEYNLKNLNCYYQHMYTGYVFILTDNQDFLSGFQVGNLGINYSIDKAKYYTIGFQIVNIWNNEYQNIPTRPMPGRNFNLSINYKL